MTTYIERDCTFTHEGRTFEAGGAVVTPDSIVAYPGRDGVLTDWHGAILGTWRATSSWRTPHSFVSSRMYQIEANVRGVVYTGRGCGVGMVFRGKRKAGQAPVRTVDGRVLCCGSYSKCTQPAIACVHRVVGDA